MSKLTAFISDVHLLQAQAPNSKLFQEFLAKTAPGLSALYILGDFFEYWVGEDLENDFQKAICLELQKLAHMGCPVYFMPGNRDFLNTKAWANKYSFQLLPDPYLLELGEKRVLLSHGDLLCNQDCSYAIYRSMVQNRLFKALFFKLPKHYRQRLAEKMRQISSQPKDRKIYSDQPQTKIMASWQQQFQFDFIVHGHTHIPRSETSRFVLSDWGREAHYLCFEAPENTWTLKNIHLHIEI
ncbi:MAG: UDP-2,3-diacylglucosamine diphosphatase [Gammaproteobacteria bacterium]